MTFNIAVSKEMFDHIKKQVDENGKFIGSIAGELIHPSNDPNLEEINKQISKDLSDIKFSDKVNILDPDVKCKHVKKEDFDKLMKAGYRFEPVIPAGLLKKNENGEITDFEISGFDIVPNN